MAAYDPYKAVNAIYNLKGVWDSANNAGDDNKKNKAAADAQAYYNSLRQNGYGSVADELSASNYANAKKINDDYANYAKAGKSKTRDYLYSLGKSRGMSQSDIDALLSFDEGTGEISLGGKNIGKPDTIVDGTSYWSDTSVLDNAFNDYVNRSGTTASDEMLASQNSQGVKSKIDSLYDTQNQDRADMKSMYEKEYNDLKNTNPFTTDEARAILGRYNLSAFRAGNNAAAAGSATNGGNIDSFSAANAMRNQAALVQKGQETVLNAYQQKLDHAKSLLEGLGVYQQNQDAGMQNTIGLQQNEAQRLYENSENSKQKEFDRDQTAKNNQVARDIEISNTSGINSGSVLYSSPYYSWFFNADGTLKDGDNIDFTTAIEKAEAAGNTDLANMLKIARGAKIYGNYSKYGQFDDGNYILPEKTQTESARELDAQLQNAKDIALNQTAANVAMNTANNQNTIDQINATADASIRVDEANKDNNSSGTTNGDNGTYYNGVLVGDKNGKPILSLNDTKKLYSNGNRSEQVTYAVKYYGITEDDINSSKSSSSGKKTLSKKEVEDIVEDLNGAIALKYGNGFAALRQDEKGRYRPADAAAEYVAAQVLYNGNLTDEQKEYLLFDVFGISEDVINDISKDSHYR